MLYEVITTSPASRPWGPSCGNWEASSASSPSVITSYSIHYTKLYEVVKAYLLEPVIVTKDNYKAIMIDSGYYKAEDIK